MAISTTELVLQASMEALHATRLVTRNIEHSKLSQFEHKLFADGTKAILQNIISDIRGNRSKESTVDQAALMLMLEATCNRVLADIAECRKKLTVP